MYYGAFLNLTGKRALVVGGGSVGERKVKKLLTAGAVVTVVSPMLTTELKRLVTENRISHRERTYVSDDLDGILLAFAATDNRAVNRQIASDAKLQSVWCNVADDKDDCDFIVPATVHVGDVHLAISTEGHMPGIAKSLRLAIEADLDDDGNRFYNLLKKLRNGDFN